MTHREAPPEETAASLAAEWVKYLSTTSHRHIGGLERRGVWTVFAGPWALGAFTSVYEARTFADRVAAGIRKQTGATVAVDNF